MCVAAVLCGVNHLQVSLNVDSLPLFSFNIKHQANGSDYRTDSNFVSFYVLMWTWTTLVVTLMTELSLIVFFSLNTNKTVNL